MIDLPGVMTQLRLNAPMELQQKINYCYIKGLFCLELFKPTLFQRGFPAPNCVCRIRTLDTRPLGQSPSEMSHMRQVQ